MRLVIPKFGRRNPVLRPRPQLMRAPALVLAISLTGCAFAVKHPAVTAGVVGGTVAFGTCELGTDLDSHGTCGIVGGSAALALAGVVALAILLGGDGHTVLQEPMTEDPPPIVRDKKPAPPPAPPAPPAPAP